MNTQRPGNGGGGGGGGGGVSPVSRCTTPGSRSRPGDGKPSRPAGGPSIPCGRSGLVADAQSGGGPGETPKTRHGCFCGRVSPRSRNVREQNADLPLSSARGRSAPMSKLTAHNRPRTVDIVRFSTETAVYLQRRIRLGERRVRFFSTAKIARETTAE
ncbi:Hypothetical protein CINCED_3A019286 [Cinara cedri]|uniref:Uncharacterized protein n=1 Tax=Cinara cedri TaxID=506608 RepID=A0A5E4MYY1_9HEMI|nr:Hypothetical protein CINCED_3A019286 [Cinara cedri]